MSEECIFCSIAAKRIPADILEEDDETIVFRDIAPKAPVHVLVVPKAHIPSVNELADEKLAGSLVVKARRAAERLGIANGYKLVFNVGRAGGQVVDHVHLHVLGGWDAETHRVEV